MGNTGYPPYKPTTPVSITPIIPAYPYVGGPTYLTISNETFTDTELNAGQFVETATVTITNAVFTGEVGNSIADISVCLPVGITGSLIKVSDTTATLSFSGTALNFQNTQICPGYVWLGPLSLTSMAGGARIEHYGSSLRFYIIGAATGRSRNIGYSISTLHLKTNRTLSNNIVGILTVGELEPTIMFSGDVGANLVGASITGLPTGISYEVRKTSSRNISITFSGNTDLDGSIWTPTLLLTDDSFIDTLADDVGKSSFTFTVQCILATTGATNPGGTSGSDLPILEEPATPTITDGIDATLAIVNQYFRVEYSASNPTTSRIITDSFDSEYIISDNEKLLFLNGSGMFTYNGKTLIDNKMGKLIEAGTTTEYADINYESKVVTMTNVNCFSDTSPLPLTMSTGCLSFSNNLSSHLMFRTPSIPLVPASLTMRITSVDGETLTATSDSSGNIIGSKIVGNINFENGTGVILTGELVNDPENYTEYAWYDEDNITIEGKLWKPILVMPDTALISCVVTSYLPLDESLLGLNTVRLPIDGKVPIFSDGRILLIHNTKQYDIDSLVANETHNIGRTNVSVIEIYDSNSLYVPETGNYTYSLVTGIVTISSTVSSVGFTAPFTIMSRVEDMVLASDVQVTGHIAIVSPITHDYTANDTLVSSVLPIGDLQSRVYNVFYQQAWTGVWSDTISGNSILAKYNAVDYPIEVFNLPSLQERWAIIFSSSSTFYIVGEHIGVIKNGGSDFSTASDFEYPANGTPWFRLKKEGWGYGWATGNVMRLNTAAANYPLWAARVRLQGPATEDTDNFILAIRGDSI